MRSVYHVKIRAPCSREDASSSMRSRKKSSTFGCEFTDRMRAMQAPFERQIDSSTETRPKSRPRKNQKKDALHATPAVAGVARQRATTPGALLPAEAIAPAEATAAADATQRSRERRREFQRQERHVGEEGAKGMFPQVIAVPSWVLTNRSDSLANGVHDSCPLCEGAPHGRRSARRSSWLSHVTGGAHAGEVLSASQVAHEDSSPRPLRSKGRGHHQGKAPCGRRLLAPSSPTWRSWR